MLFAIKLVNSGILVSFDSRLTSSANFSGVSLSASSPKIFLAILDPVAVTLEPFRIVAPPR